MQNAIQSWYKAIGDWGCYFLCLLDIAEEYHKKINNRTVVYDVIEIAKKIGELGYMKLNVDNLKDTDNFYILEPAKILEYLTGGTWIVTWQGPKYEIKPNDYVIRCFINEPYSHFNRENFDSLQNSYTVKYGQLDSYRIFNKVA